MIFGFSLYTWAFLLASTTTMGAVVCTMVTIVQHTVHKSKPQLRTYTIRVLMMVPIYAIEALLGLVVQDWSEILEVWRECYEAFTLFSFMQLMLSYLTIDATTLSHSGASRVALSMKGKEPVPHQWPVDRLLDDWPMGPVFLRNTLVGVFQYCVVMLVVTFLSLSTWMVGIYSSNESSSLKNSKTYLILIQSVSQMWALYCLVLFYQATRRQLRQIQPLHKFVCIKLVVFFTFWQEWIIAYLVETKFIGASNFTSGYIVERPGDETVGMASEWTTTEVSNAINNFVICLEMLGFAIAHVYVFPSSDYIRAERMSIRQARQYAAIKSGGGDHGAPKEIGGVEWADPEENISMRAPLMTIGGAINRKLVQQLIDGLNFFDLIADIREMNDLQDDDAASDLEKESLVESFGTF
jgi:hypothetical protein